jgi:uncharacterized protein YggU (UPF0235/DUF167 family)
MAKVQPRSRRPGLLGIVDSADGPRLRIGVVEAAEGGRANRAACATLAQALGVPPSAVRIVAGAASRQKRLLVAGDPAVIAARMALL